MVARRKRAAPKKKLSTKFKQQPINTVKAEFRKLGPVGKAAVVGIAAGATSVSAAAALDGLPVIGKYMSVFTNWGRSIGLKMK
jgi:hypothetical protein